MKLRAQIRIRITFDMLSIGQESLGRLHVNDLHLGRDVFGCSFVNHAQK